MEQDKSTKKYVIDLNNPIPRGKEYILNPKRICKNERIPELANLTEEEKEDIRKRVHEALQKVKEREDEVKSWRMVVNLDKAEEILDRIN